VETHKSPDSWALPTITVAMEGRIESALAARGLQSHSRQQGRADVPPWRAQTWQLTA